MKILRNILILSVAFAGLAWAGGVRFHPERIPSYVSGGPRKTYQKITLKTGKVIAGAIAEESEESVSLEMEGGLLGISQKEIAGRSAIEPDDPEFGKMGGDGGRSRFPPLFSYLPSKNYLIRLFPVFSGSKAPAVQPARTVSRPQTSNNSAVISSTAGGSTRGTSFSPTSVSNKFSLSSSLTKKASEEGTGGGASNPNSYMGLVRSISSPEARERIKQQMMQEMQNVPRNPYFDVSRQAQEAEQRK